MRYQQIQDLIQYYAAFEESTGLQDLHAFARWLGDQTGSVESVSYSAGEPTGGNPQSPDELISQGLAMLANHARHYIKTATQGTKLSGWNDTILLIALFHRGPQRKTALIRTILIDVSAGIEVIRRLVRKGLLEEYADPDDKRAKLVKLTADGTELVKKMDVRLDTVSRIVAGNLTDTEKTQLVPLLYKLVTFHEPIFQEDYGSDLDEILEKYK